MRLWSSDKIKFPSNLEEPIEVLQKYIHDNTWVSRCRCQHCEERYARDGLAAEDVPQGQRELVLGIRDVVNTGCEAGRLRELIAKAKRGFACEADPLNGEPMSLDEMDAWTGHRDTTLRLMTVGKMLGLWSMRTPFDRKDLPYELKTILALAGYVAIKAPSLSPCERN